MVGTRMEFASNNGDGKEWCSYDACERGQQKSKNDANRNGDKLCRNL